MKKETHSPFDYINSISETKSYMIKDKLTEKFYDAFLTNIYFSNSFETIFHANKMNSCSAISNKQQYDYYFYSLPKKKRRLKWPRKIKVEDLEVIKEYYKYNDTRAKEALRLLSSDQIAMIKEKLRKGGRTQ